MTSSPSQNSHETNHWDDVEEKKAIGRYLF